MENLQIIKLTEIGRKGEWWVVKPHLSFGEAKRPRSDSVNTMSVE